MHVERKPGRVTEILVLARAARGKRWEVVLDGKPRERFSVLEDAVQAVDYEIGRMGRGAAASALASASWRRAAPPPELVASLRAARPASLGEALRLATWERIVGAPAARR